MAVESVAVAEPSHPPSSRLVQVMVIGGGLAGMSAALRLAQQPGCKVTLYEAGDRLGGKAGSNRNTRGGYDDHGFHIFPGWYLNIWKLIDDLKIRDRFIALHDFFQLHLDDYRELPVNRFHTLHDAPAYWNLVRNLRSSPLPIYETALFFYSTIDLATHKLKQNDRLDQISVTGFLRSRFYRTELMATVYQDLMLKAISVPSYFVSAATTRHVIRYWMNYPAPMHHVLDGSLQERFIQPIQNELIRRGVQICLNQRLEELQVGRNHIDAVKLMNLQSSVSQIVAVDQVVLAIPAERVDRVCTSDLYEQCTTLGNVRGLRTRPMAALNLYFKHRIPNLPSSHVNLVGSKYGLTFIDTARVWDSGPSPSDGSILNVIATDYTELEGVDSDSAADALVQELQRFIPFDKRDIVDRKMQPHLNAPLFMNDVGIWHFRPKAAPVVKDKHVEQVEIDNLFLAGDYCRSHVDLVSMEGAFTTGLQAANKLLETVFPGVKSEEPLRPGRISVMWWFLWLAGLPVAALLKLVAIWRARK